MPEIERIPPDEPQQIAHIVEMTIQQLRNRYPAEKQILRGVHAKDHGCATAEFAIRTDLPENLRVGLFAHPGKQHSALVRFSNAATLITPDSNVDGSGKTSHGSRGMAIKVLGIEGEVLGPVHGAATQDFLMVNHPVFAFANVEDYEVLSEAVTESERPDKFFATRLPRPDQTTPLTDAQLRAKRTFEIVSRIRSAGAPGDTSPFQTPPASPLDNSYFSAAPFSFGDDRVMKYRAVPVAPASDKPDVSNPDYLRAALTARLRDSTKGPVEFRFEVQVRPVNMLHVATEIEDATEDWPEERFPFEHVATLTVPPQEIDTGERHQQCEALIFTPWHCLAAHKPLGGINRLRKAVYEASAMFRHLPKEPAGQQ